MTLRPRSTPDETRHRIMNAAEEQFRRVGYAKTAVADIANALNMSPANIYRFFASKLAINEAICRRFLAESEARMAEIVAGDDPAPERIARLIRTLHMLNRSRFVGEQRVHEMVAVAMSENWHAIEEHITLVVTSLTTLVSQGMASGHFANGDARAMALTVKDCCGCLLHPQMIAECVRHDRDMQDMCDRLIDFILAGLSARHGARP